MLIFNAAISGIVNLILLVVIPSIFFVLYQRRWRQRSFAEIRERLGLKFGEPRYLSICLGFSLVVAVILMVFPPTLDSMDAEENAMGPFAGLGLTAISVSMALIYGVATTGLAEEFLFRGMITGALSRRFPATRSIWS
jgi:membrane protease YdiL (CAAX protease family)